MYPLKQTMLTSIKYLVLQKTNGLEFTYDECCNIDSALIVITIKKTLEDNMKLQKAGYQRFEFCSATSFFPSTLYIT